ncbi:BTAD domain-containing putative transcriptional regulator [Actinomadura sp. 6N118]|uniref:AfsR/SARP family transcriptional regulator n=1 Tax=Actinomadura sp. 6N118 TaxID=3375151 RepID=UPI0037AF72BA
MLAMLALHSNRMVQRSLLIDALWEDPPATAEAQVRRQVSWLRRALDDESGIVTDPGGYRLRIDPERVDAQIFRRLVADARRATEAGDLDKAGRELANALELWHGPALADVRGPYFEAEAARLEEFRLVAQQEYAATRLAAGEDRDLIGELTAQVSRYPLREGPRAQLMLALHRAGRQAEALETYRRGRDTLVAELGLEPSQELTRLHQAILASDPGLRLGLSSRVGADHIGLRRARRQRPAGESPDGHVPDPRDALITRLKNENSTLKRQVLAQGATIGKLISRNDLVGLLVRGTSIKGWPDALRTKEAQG